MSLAFVAWNRRLLMLVFPPCSTGSYPWFMESVWWVFSELFKKNLVYRGFRVMPFSTALATPLSNFEANQEFHETKDPWYENEQECCSEAVPIPHGVILVDSLQKFG